MTGESTVRVHAFVLHVLACEQASGQWAPGQYHQTIRLRHGDHFAFDPPIQNVVEWLFRN